MTLTAIAIMLLAACTSSPRLPENVPPADRDKYGEFYNLKEYAKCREQSRNPGNLACEYLRLTRVEEPEYWPYPDVPRPKLPRPPNPPAYQEGMTSRKYFDALCKAEAGEFIYKVVENVEGVYQIRPRKEASWDALTDRYVMEDPYGYTSWEAGDPKTLFVDPPYRNYRFIEVPHVTKEKRLEFARLTNRTRSTSHSLESRYGFLWRGIRRPHDRELGIAGGELAVVDLRSGEVLGLRRGFVRTGQARTRSGINWESAQVCPMLRTGVDLTHKWPSFAYAFISKVLRPIRPE